MPRLKHLRPRSHESREHRNVNIVLLRVQWSMPQIVRLASGQMLEFFMYPRVFMIQHNNFHCGGAKKCNGEQSSEVRWSLYFYGVYIRLFIPNLYNLWISILNILKILLKFNQLCSFTKMLGNDSATSESEDWVDTNSTTRLPIQYYNIVLCDIYY